jgi:hypothetical protein
MRTQIRPLIGLAGLGIGQQKRLVFGDNGIIAAAEAFLLMRLIFRCADKSLHGRHLQQAIKIVIMAHEILRKGLLFQITAVFGGDGLQLLHKRISGMVAGNRLGAVVRYLNLVRRVIVSP